MKRMINEKEVVTNVEAVDDGLKISKLDGTSNTIEIGGGNLYCHCITLQGFIDGSSRYVTIVLYTNNNTQFVFDTLKTYIYDHFPNIIIPCWGWSATSPIGFINGVYVNAANSPYIRGRAISQGATTLADINFQNTATLSDTVTQIL